MRNLILGLLCQTDPQNSVSFLLRMCSNGSFWIFTNRCVNTIVSSLQKNFRKVHQNFNDPLGMLILFRSASMKERRNNIMEEKETKRRKTKPSIIIKSIKMCCRDNWFYVVNHSSYFYQLLSIFNVFCVGSGCANIGKQQSERMQQQSTRIAVNTIGLACAYSAGAAAALPPFSLKVVNQSLLGPVGP